MDTGQDSATADLFQCLIEIEAPRIHDLLRPQRSAAEATLEGLPVMVDLAGLVQTFCERSYEPPEAGFIIVHPCFTQDADLDCAPGVVQTSFGFEAPNTLQIKLQRSVKR